MSKNKKSGGKQAPAQRHAEGQHGSKTTEFLRKQHVAQSGNADGGAKAERQASAKRKG